MKTMILTNNFHNTEVHLRPTLITAENCGNDAKLKRHIGRYLLTHRQAKRAAKQLCGVSDCCCGGQFGQRGAQDWYEVVDETYNRDFILRFEDDWGKSAKK